MSFERTKRGAERGKPTSIEDKTAEMLARYVVIEPASLTSNALDEHELRDSFVAHALTAGNREFHVATAGNAVEHGSVVLGVAEPSAAVIGDVGSYFPMPQDSVIGKAADVIRVGEMIVGGLTGQPYLVADGAQGLARSILTREAVKAVKKELRK